MSFRKASFPCATQLETILGLARKGINSTDVTFFNAPEKAHIQGAFRRLEEHLRSRGVSVEAFKFPACPPRQGWRLPHGKRTDDRAGIRP